MKPAVFVTRPLAVDAAAYLGREFEVTVNHQDKPLTQNQIIEAAQGASGLVTMLHDPIDVRLLDALPSLKVVANVAVGFNNIDVAACSERGIVVCNTPGVLTEATADLTWTLILACTRRVREGEKLVRTGQFDGWGPNLLLGLGLQNRTLGIFGLGRIGRAVARRAKAFGMEVIYHNRQALDAATEEALGARWVSKETLLATSDILSLHAPLSADTLGAFGTEEFAAMKDGSVLINTARGPLVEEDALVRALGSGKLWAAGLDVYELEPEVHPGLLHRDDVVLLPHLGSATQACRARMAQLALDDAAAVLRGEAPRHAVSH